MNIYLVSENNKYIEYWNSFISTATISTLDDVSLFKVDDIIILDNKLYSKTLKIEAKVIILDSEPNFERCLFLLQSDVKAYGNVYMHSTHILSAIESLKESKVWMYPDFIANILALSQNKSEDILDRKIEVLTSREKEIAKLILNGLTNKEIAIALEISINTIKVHTKHIYEKLNVTDRLSLFSLLN